MAITQQQPAKQTQGNETARLEHAAERDVRPAMTFFAKFSADQATNLAGDLAYNFLIAIFPLMLVLLAVAGLVIGSLSPIALQSLEKGIANALPSGIGSTVIHAATTNLSRNAGVILIIGLLSAIFVGSRLFVAMEFCLSVIYRIQQRQFLQQNLVAIAMTVAFAIAGPVVFLASSVPTAIISRVPAHSLGIISVLLYQLLGLVIAFLVAFAFFAGVFYVVPNQHMRWRAVWKGAAVAAALLVVYELLFPLYESLVLKPGNYGSLAGFAILLLVFFYYLSIIILLGAEVNAWASGVRDPGGDFMSYLRDQAKLQQQQQAQKKTGRAQTHTPAHEKTRATPIRQPSRPTRNGNARQPSRQPAPTPITQPGEGASLTAAILGGLTALSILALQWLRRTRAA